MVVVVMMMTAAPLPVISGEIRCSLIERSGNVAVFAKVKKGRVK